MATTNGARRRAQRTILAAVISSVMCACGDTSGPEVSYEPDPAPAATNTAVPLFYRPFIGDYPLLNYFDHHYPSGPVEDGDGYQLTWRGERAIPGIHIRGYDGHTGYDWLLPENTPLFAMANGYVIFAGETPPSYCVFVDKEVSTIAVTIRYPAPNGEIFTSHYAHMNRADVAVGDQVTAGQHVGLSGATGCIGGVAHLHMTVYRLQNTNSGSATFIDPYGWEGADMDPWSQHPLGAASVWLWLPGEAPSLVSN